MKLSRRRKHTKRSKYTRHTKHGRGKQYNTKRKYRKYSHKLKYKSRLQKGGMLRSGKVAPEPPSQLAPEPQLVPSQFEFPDSVPDPFTKLVENTEDNMTVSPDYKTYTFENSSSGEYPVFKSSSEEGARLMNLNFKKSEGSTFRSGDKILNKQFKWRITLKEIEDITRISPGALRQYKYTYSIMLYRLSEKEGAITLETDVYVIISTAYKSNSIAAERVFIGNVTEHSTGSSTGSSTGTQRVKIPNLSQGLTLQVYTNGTSTGNKTYTFPYGEQNNFNNITRVLSDLAYIGDLMVLKKLYTSLNSTDVKTHKKKEENVAQTIIDFNKVTTADYLNRRLCKIPPVIYTEVENIIENRAFRE